MALPEPLAVTLRVAEAFERLHLRYLIGGSLASSLHGIPRSTNDADVVAEIPLQSVNDLVRNLESEFDANPAMILDAVRHGTSFNLIHLTTMFKVDVFVLRREPMMIEEMQRRQEHPIAPDAPSRVYFASPEDTVLQKLDWYRKGNEVSERQWGDVLGVLRVQADAFDLVYARKWAPDLGVLDLLERALTEAHG